MHIEMFCRTCRNRFLFPEDAVPDKCETPDCVGTPEIVSDTEEKEETENEIISP